MMAINDLWTEVNQTHLEHDEGEIKTPEAMKRMRDACYAFLKEVGPPQVSALYSLLHAVMTEDAGNLEVALRHAHQELCIEIDEDDLGDRVTRYGSCLNNGGSNQDSGNVDD